MSSFFATYGLTHGLQGWPASNKKHAAFYKSVVHPSKVDHCSKREFPFNMFLYLVHSEAVSRDLLHKQILSFFQNKGLYTAEQGCNLLTCMVKIVSWSVWVWLINTFCKAASWVWCQKAEDVDTWNPSKNTQISPSHNINQHPPPRYRHSLMVLVPERDSGCCHTLKTAPGTVWGGGRRGQGVQLASKCHKVMPARRGWLVWSHASTRTLDHDQCHLSEVLMLWLSVLTIDFINRHISFHILAGKTTIK